MTPERSELMKSLGIGGVLGASSPVLGGPVMPGLGGPSLPAMAAGGVRWLFWGPLGPVCGRLFSRVNQKHSSYGLAREWT